MPFPIIAALPSIASGLGSALNFFSNQSNMNQQAEVSRENTDKTIQANKDAANIAYQRDIQQWNNANNYNSPSAQMGRLKQAGLNPMLAYGTGNVGGLSAGPSPTMHVPQQNYQYVAKQRAPLDLSFMQQAQSLKLGQAQIDNVQANTDATRATTANEIIRNTLLEIEKEFARPLGAAQVTKESIAAKYAERNALLDLLVKQAGMLATEQGTRIAGMMAPSDLQIKEGQVHKQTAEIQEIMARTKNIPLSGILTKAQTANTESETDLKKLQKLLNNQDLVQKEYENWLRSKGTAPGDSPWSKGTRDFSIFMEYLMDKITGTKREFKK